jgi:Flp pilus assembly protein TadG
MYHGFWTKRWRTLGSQRHGAVSLEFVILSIPFFMLSLGTMEIGYDFFVQAALSNAVNVAARSVQVGASQGDATGAKEVTWVQNAVCPALGQLLDCGQLYVSISSTGGEDYYTYLTANPPNLATMASSSDSVCTGGAAQMMLLRAYYVSPSFLGMLVPNWSMPWPQPVGPRVHVTYASAGFVNEYFSAGEVGC